MKNTKTTHKHRGFLLTKSAAKKKWYVCAKPFYYWDWPEDLTASTRLELMATMDRTLVRLGYLTEGS